MRRKVERFEVQLAHRPLQVSRTRGSGLCITHHDVERVTPGVLVLDLVRVLRQDARKRAENVLRESRRSLVREPRIAADVGKQQGPDYATAAVTTRDLLGHSDCR